MPMRLKKLIFLLLILLFSVAVLLAEGFDIVTYNINLDVEEDGLMHITEDISVHFTKSSHGIYRDIQTEFDNPFGNEFDPVKAKISNVKVNRKYNFSSIDGGKRIKIGDSNEYAPEYESYAISYDYTLDYDRYPDYDELYYNLIAPAWDCPIENIAWSVTLPHAISKKSIWVTYGATGSKEAGTFALNGKGNKISGILSHLNPKEALTLRIEMREGYWVGQVLPKDHSQLFLNLGGIFTILLLILTILLWYFYGNDDPLEIQKRNTPPQGLSPMEVGYLQDDEISVDKELLSMIFYWAEQGLLTIEKKEEAKGKKTETRYVLHKKKELEGAPSYEENLFHIIFTKDTVTTDDIIASNFTEKAITEVVQKMKETFTKGEKAMRSKESLKMQIILIILWFLASIFDGIFLGMRYPGLLCIIFGLILLFNTLFQGLIGNLWSTKGNTWTTKTKTLTGVLAVLIFCLFLGAGLALSYSARLSLGKMSFYFGTILLSSTIGIWIAGFTDKLSTYGQDTLEECIGYLHYLRSLTREQMVTEERNHPGFFNQTMPYALAMGISKEWAEKAKDLDSFQEPSWFHGEDFSSNYLWYYLFFQSYHKSYVHSSLNVATTSSGGSGYHSSGFTGGGFSGGGGGRW